MTYLIMTKLYCLTQQYKLPNKKFSHSYFSTRRVNKTAETVLHRLLMKLNKSMAKIIPYFFN